MFSVSQTESGHILWWRAAGGAGGRRSLGTYDTPAAAVRSAEARQTNARVWAAIAEARVQGLGPATRAEIYDALAQRRSMRSRRLSEQERAELARTFEEDMRTWGRVERPLAQRLRANP